MSSAYLEEGSVPDASYNIAVHLCAGVPITDLNCSSHETVVEWNTRSDAKVTLSDPGDYAGNRDFILEYKLTGENLSSGPTLYTGEEENFFLMTVQPPERYETKDIPHRKGVYTHR